MRLKGKVAIVTGGGRGIGKAVCLAFAKEGADVVVNYESKAEPAQEVVETVKKIGRNAVAVKGNVAVDVDAERIIQTAIDSFEKIDILVNNAGFVPGKKPFYEISSDEWDQVLGINLKGMFLCCKAVYHQMKKQGKGKIINVSSETFLVGVPYFSHYVASKGGVVAFTRALARELGDSGISVNTITPGLVITESVQAIYPEAYLRATVSGRCFKRDELPKDLTGTFVFLASEDSDFITGQTILVDGGAAFL